MTGLSGVKRWLLNCPAASAHWVSFVAWISSRENCVSPVSIVVPHGTHDRFRIAPIWDGVNLEACWGVVQRCNGEGEHIGCVQLDHITVCVPQLARNECMKQIAQQLRLSLCNGEKIESIKGDIDFDSFTVGGVGVNVVSPIRRVAHLDKFISKRRKGGVHHIGINVTSIEDALNFCASTGISTLADRLRWVERLDLPPDSAVSMILDKGFSEDTSHTGTLRQSFVFPCADGPILELVERQGFVGYSENTSNALVKCLDAASLVGK